MWIMSTLGFFSVVIDNTHPDRILIRARSKGQMARLLAHCDLDVPVHVTPDHDYPVRIFVPRETWLRIADELARTVKYPNFKDAAERAFAGDEDEWFYVPALHDVWLVMRQSEQFSVRMTSDQAATVATEGHGPEDR